MTESPAPALRVLIIDDEEDNHVILKGRLAETGGWNIEVSSASDAHGAFSILRKKLFDVAFLDYRLPDGDGVKVLEQIRQLHPKVAVIMMSAWGDEKVAVEAIRRGAIDYMVRSDLEAADMTRLLRRALEMQILQGENAELRQVNRMKDEFISSVSHELRTPLAVILGYAKSMEDGDLGELSLPQKKAVEAIGRRGSKLLEMLNSLLAFKDSSQGQQQVVLRSTNFTEFMREIVASDWPEYKKKGIEILPALPDIPLWVLSDQPQLKEVFTNLISNALKFSPEKSSIRITLEAHGDKEVWVKIKDQGRGIPPEALPRLFEGFFHTDKDLTREVSGLGLGLVLARQTVELHGGRIWLESEGPGAGTTACVSLPISSADANQVVVEQSKKADKKKILICEDNEDIIEIIQLFLANFSDNLVLSTTERGQEALERLTQSNFDLLILDLMMPGMSGFDVMERMQRLPKEKQLPVLIVSGHQEAAKQAVVKGAKAFILKPFSKNIFLNKVLELLGLERRSKSRTAAESENAI